MHQRYGPARHLLRYPVYFYVFDLDELPRLHESVRGFSYNHFNVASLRDRDYLKGEGSIKERLMALLKDRSYAARIRRVELVTSARYLGYVFNPVSFFFCYDARGQAVCVVAEVNNTFGERHFYILDKKKKTGEHLEFRQDKDFHVSPFNDRRGHYEMKFSPLKKKASIEVTLIRDGEKIMTALLTGQSRELTSAGLMKTLIGFPLTALKTVARIYREAAVLFFVKKLKYHRKPVPRSDMTITLRRPAFRKRLARRVIEFFLRHFMEGSLSVTYPDGVVRTLGHGNGGPSAAISIRSHDFFWRVFTQGDIGFGEAYMQGLWDSRDVPALLDLIMANIQHYDVRKSFLRSLSRTVKKARHPLRRNTLPGSRKNIGAHYDLGNDFFGAFLDRSMLYSCALYNSKDDTLEKAQRNKARAIIEKAHIGPGDRVLEIGSGWGGFALEAARHTGCHVTTVTISRRQYEYVIELVKRRRMENRITVLFQDYRTITGEFDRIVSIEMLEAIGLEYFGAFFERCEALLSPRGIMAHQIIMLPDHRLKQYRNSHDWLRKHIFPGGMLPTLSVIVRAMEKHSTFHVHSLEDIGPHYARTLYDWRVRFDLAAGELARMGYDEVFQRKWRYYLMTCESLFKNRVIYDAIMVFSRQYNLDLPLDPALAGYAGPQARRRR
jgi:cyclopropane-fatty-acyl-phospholipid synthase